MPLQRSNHIALLISLIAFLSAYWVAENIYEGIPHVEDEFAYVWQAQVFAHGQAFISSPPHSDLLIVPFVVDYGGLRFSKYPPGWSLLLMFGAFTGSFTWINSILAGLGTWLIYRLGQKIFDNSTALLAAGLMVSSPFFLLNSGALLSHPWSLVLCLSLTIAWLDLFFEKDKSLPAKTIPNWMKIYVAGLSLGALALTRPLTAIGVGLPFFLHGLILLWQSGHTTRKHILTIGLITGIVALFLPLWQYLLSGDPFQNLYTLWWKYDRIGFGAGVGTQPGGHDLFWVINNLVLSLVSGSNDLFGWRGISWLFIPFGLWAARRDKRIELVIGIPAGLALAYTIYWISPDLYGPRYYYECLIGACLLSAAGITWLANGCNKSSVSIAGQVSVALLVLCLVGYNLLIYLPARFDSMRNLYNINRLQQKPFTTAEASAHTPALVVVHTNEWTDCAGLLELQDPWLTTPFIFACDINNSGTVFGPDDYPGREILHYYPDTMEINLLPQH